ncbi:MAG: DNA replication/repair protein RecF [Crocinitomicaceae bacterium]
MFLTQLLLHNFKNYQLLDLELCPGINGLVGKNGSGKTNVLDAVHYLSMCKSYLNNIDRQNIHFDQPFFSIQGNWNLESKAVEVHCAFKLGAKKVIKYNKKPYEKITEHIGRFPVVFISPYDGDLIAEGSDMRRKWMDGILVQLDKNYLNDLQRYQKVLDQRNALLKNMFEHRLFDRESIEVWNIQLVSMGDAIFKKRDAFLKEFIPVFKKFYYEIGHDAESIGIEYRSQLNEGNFSDLLAESEKKDAFSQYTNVGIHKDDLIFTIKGYPVKKFGSQGQQKSFLIALRLAQYDYLKMHTRLKPVLLLDDIFDKLDNERVEKLIRLVTADYFGQVIVSDTDERRMVELFQSLKIEKKLFRVEEAQITEINL